MNANFDGEAFNAIGNSFHNFAPKYRPDFKPYCDVFILARNRSPRVDCLVLCTVELLSLKTNVQFQEKKLWEQSCATILTDS